MGGLLFGWGRVFWVKFRLELNTSNCDNWKLLRDLWRNLWLQDIYMHF